MSKLSIDEYKHEYNEAKDRYIQAMRYNRCLDFRDNLINIWQAVDVARWQAFHNGRYTLSAQKSPFHLYATLVRVPHKTWRVSVDIQYIGDHRELDNLSYTEWGSHAYTAELTGKIHDEKDAKKEALKFIQKKLTQLKKSRTQELEKLLAKAS